MLIENLLFTFLPIGFLYLGILGFKSGNIFAHWISAYLIYDDPRGLFV